MYGHHDANGQATWISPQSGAKIWIVIQPKDADADVTPIEEYYKILDKVLPDLDAIPDGFRVFTILVEPGQTL